MKKISVLLIIILFSLSLTGCQLAVIETDNTDDTSLSSDKSGYIPIRFNYSILDGELIDVSDYIFYTWLFSESLNDEYLITGVDGGTSMEILVSASNTNIVSSDDGTEIREDSEIMEANIYISKDLEGIPLYPTVTYLNYDDEIITEQGYGFAMQEGLSTTYTYDSQLSNGDTFSMELTLNIIVLDELQKIEIHEFDFNDNLILTTTITESTLLEELTLNTNTDYIFIVETYLDENEEEYTERLYYYDEKSIYYNYKYLNEDGFLYLDYLKIYFPE